MLKLVTRLVTLIRRSRGDLVEKKTYATSTFFLMQCKIWRTSANWSIVLIKKILILGF